MEIGVDTSGVDTSRVDYACHVVLYSEFDTQTRLDAYANSRAHLEDIPKGTCHVAKQVPGLLEDASKQLPGNVPPARLTEHLRRLG
ncbi:hypothetical protein LJR084_006155 [Variovorax sp. LjRoot84]|uniref:hypothetical protein n=1 Tax=Variovorax sp. LjRoot84 TaxID=3342340 RepID=UPI003ECC4C0E